MVNPVQSNGDPYQSSGTPSLPTSAPSFSLSTPQPQQPKLQSPISLGAEQSSSKSGSQPTMGDFYAYMAASLVNNMMQQSQVATQQLNQLMMQGQQQ